MISPRQIEPVLAPHGYSLGRIDDQAQRARDFRKIVKGQNFMTPTGAGFYRLKAKPYVIVEISLGEFMKNDIIGCTAVDCATAERLDDDSECLYSLDELPGYFAKLERKFS